MSNTPRHTRSNSKPNSNNISLNDIKILIENSKTEILQNIKNEVGRLSDMVEKLVKRVDELDIKNNNLEQRCIQLEVNMKENASATPIFDELEERNRRKTNLVVTGIPEQTHGTAEERKQLDRQKIESLLKELHDLHGNMITHVFRIGRKTNDKDRLMRIVCNNENTKELFLSKVRQRKLSDSWRGIYINPDRTKMQQQEEKALRTELLRRKGRGEEVYISRGKIMSKSNSSNFQ